MRPANGRVSATALQAWEECQRKYVNKYLHYIDTGATGLPALEGSALHYALEHFVKEVFFDKITEWENISRLLEIYKEGYEIVFGTSMIDADILKDALSILKNWHERNDFTNVKILSTEEKLYLDVKDKSGTSYDIPMTYIFDRCDYYEEDGSKVLKIVDYKSSRFRWTYDDIKEKIQPLVYAVAAMVQYRDLDYDELWVEIDLLRFDECISLRFTREDAIRGWHYLQRTIETILNTEEDDAQYSIGPGCRFCPIKESCPALLGNAGLGGTTGLLVGYDIDQLIEKRSEISSKIEALKNLLDEYDENIYKYAENNDVSDFQSEDFNVKLVSTGKRKISNSEVVAKILGPEIMQQEGNINITTIDKLIKDKRISDEQAEKIAPYIKKMYGKASIRVSKKPPFDKD